jgi:hypothetical protein
MVGDTQLEYALAVVAHDEEALQKTESHARKGEEVHGGDGFAMTAKKHQPAPDGFWVSGCSFIQRSDTLKPSMRS